MAQSDTTPNHHPESNHLLDQAEGHLQAGRYDEAIALYQTLVEQHPEDDSYLLSLAWACHDCGQIEDAVAWFEKLFDREVSRRIFSGFAFDELVRIFKRQERHDRLLTICERALAAQPGDFSLMGDLGEAYLKMGQTEKAVSVFRQMTEMEPEAAMVFCQLGNALIALHDFTGADEAYERAATIDPDLEAAYYYRLAEEYRKAGEQGQAEQAIRRSLAQEATEPAYHLFLGDLFIGDGRTDEGWTAYEAAVGLRPASAGVYYHRLGNTLTQAKHHERAVLAFQKAIVAEPENPFYRLRLAEALAAMGREDLAREALR